MKTKLAVAVATAAGVMVSGAVNAQSPREESGFESSMNYDEYLGTNDLRASDLVGAMVRNPRGEDLGEIEDLIVSRDDDVITAVISVGGFLDIGDKLVGVPYDDLRVSSSGDALYLSATEEQLESLPNFEYDAQADERDAAGDVPTAGVDESRPSAPRAQAADAADAADAGDEADVANRNVAAPGSEPAQQERSAAAVADEEAVRQSEPARDVEVMGPGAHRASNLIGKTVFDSSGDEVGEIDDLVVSAEGGIEAVLSIGGIGGFGDRLVAVSVDALEIGSVDPDTEEGEAEIRIDMTAQQLMDTSPEFSYDLRAARSE